MPGPLARPSLLACRTSRALKGAERKRPLSAWRGRRRDRAARAATAWRRWLRDSSNLRPASQRPASDLPVSDDGAQPGRCAHSPQGHACDCSPADADAWLTPPAAEAQERARLDQKMLAQPHTAAARAMAYIAHPQAGSSVLRQSPHDRQRRYRSGRVSQPLSGCHSTCRLPQLGQVSTICRDFTAGSSTAPAWCP